MSDDLAPFHPLIGLSKGSPGYFNKYPLVHRVILALVNILNVRCGPHAAADGFRLYEFLVYVRSADFASAHAHRPAGVGRHGCRYRAVHLSRDASFGRRAALGRVRLHERAVESTRPFEGRGALRIWGMGGLYFLIKAAKEERARLRICRALRLLVRQQGPGVRDLFSRLSRILSSIRSLCAGRGSPRV